MLRLTQNQHQTRCQRVRGLSSNRSGAATGKSLIFLLLAATLTLSSCGGGNSYGSAPQVPLTLSGNWQFTMAPPHDGSFLGGLQGGFLLQTNGSVTGGASYAVSLSNLLVPCNSGSATITGTISGQQVKTLTAVAGTQTFTLAGTLSSDGSTMAGTYSSTAGTAGDGTSCGTAQTGLQWSAVLVPPLTGSIQGTFHSTGGASGLNEQEFLVSGALIQAVNTGASNATLTGNLTFLNVLTNLSDYPCFTSGLVYGQISGNSVTLEIVGPDGTQLGLIGEPVGSLGGTGINPLTFNSASGGYVLRGAGPSYLVSTTACPGTLASVSTAGDFGNVCLAVNSTSPCQQPITLTPNALTFAPQAVGSPATTQTITLANVTSADLGNLTLTLTNNSGAINFTENDTCGVNGVPAQGQPFNLAPEQSCDIVISFVPQEICTPGTPPSQCPSPLTATLTVTLANNNMIYTVPITGTGMNGSAITARESDFRRKRSTADLAQLKQPRHLGRRV
jgi:hypothetical protein